MEKKIIEKEIVKNKNVRRAIMTAALFSGLSLTVLSGCNYDMLDFHYQYNKAIVFGDNVATIIEINKWTDYDGEQIQIETTDGLLLVTSSFDTKLVNDLNSESTAEDIVRAKMGDDVEIRYYNKSKSLNRN
jgi:hypothetical protein